MAFIITVQVGPSVLYLISILPHRLIRDECYRAWLCLEHVHIIGTFALALYNVKVGARDFNMELHRY